MPPRHSSYDAVVVGGGYFGCSLALALAEQGHRVLVCEAGGQLLGRASYHNQARVHQGYHYPRSVLTALRSRVNFPRWVAAYPECIVDDFDKYYAVARPHSKVTASQFERFMQRIGAPLAPAPAAVVKLFDPALIEQVWTVREYAFDAVKLRLMLETRLAAAGVECCLHTTATHVRENGGRLALSLAHADGPCEVEGRHVFNTTYSQLNRLLNASRLPTIRLKHEVTEMALVTVPEPLAKSGVTVMCGPYFSLMPFPARGLHTLSHVRYTPHGSWQDHGEIHAAGAAFEAGARPASHFRHMLADSRRYLPLLAGCRQVDSLWEIKTVLPASEEDDSRPILFRRDFGLKNLHCVMGAKIDNIFDVLDECRSFAA
jgi:glycine/D-amino acid oxidase-like deaminating enzyme